MVKRNTIVWRKRGRALFLRSNYSGFMFDRTSSYLFPVERW